MLWIRWLVTGALLAGSLFCLFGYLATFEPVANALLFRVAYGLIGAMLLGGAVFMPARRCSVCRPRGFVVPCSAAQSSPPESRTANYGTVYSKSTVPYFVQDSSHFPCFRFPTLS
jgi:hypothetical protein